MQKIIDQIFVINPVIIGNGKKDWKEVQDMPETMMALGELH
jgi:hypothetical protein